MISLHFQKLQLLKETLTMSKQQEILTGEVDGKARLGYIKVSLKLYGDDVESGVDALRQQRAANLPQRHLVLRRPIPHLQDVVGRLCVERKELETAKDTRDC